MSEVAKFQDEVRYLLLGLLTSAGLEGTDIDGGGCDSGAWQDFTLSEIRQGFNGLADYYHDRNEEQTKELERVRGERDAVLARIDALLGGAVSHTAPYPPRSP